MKKTIKMILITLVVLLIVLLTDTIQAKLFNNRPILKVVENYNGGNLYQINKGFLVDTYICPNGTKKAVFKWEKYSCPNKVQENESESNMEIITSIDVIIDNKKYIANIENNDTAQSFMRKLPQSFNMKELNGNEKYVYMPYSLPTESVKPKHIEAGDIMLYEDNCLVIFYKSFDTNYSYTKIGHIDDLPELGRNSINVTLQAIE